MKKVIIIALIALASCSISCSKEYSASNNCGKVLNKIHEGSPYWSEQPPRNEIWAIAVSVTDSTERWVGVDSSTWNKVQVGDRWCD